MFKYYCPEDSSGKRYTYVRNERMAIVEAIKYVDEVIPENSWDQKLTDIKEHDIDVFVMGDDWKGKFDFLKDEGVEVVYLPRTPDISTTKIKKQLKLK
ncbi:MAG: glycerol-3-phosphate cytidylyltransferase [bacterium]